jgi:hypothetical protein
MLKQKSLTGIGNSGTRVTSQKMAGLLDI